ncbi:meiotic recombination protein SPO11-2 isoform X2 [Lolium rigidum]|uniref:meiotic recombination protein SPO11-2 isoform X2 n=1 Tax=Lolium rigidum TaxID=89674 RepID=UPI001F5C8C59|nr:meiotic recombination protein SPO11-2 isoform X2 [Lolium rigidum]
MAETDVAAASLFGADRRLCSADVLSPPEVRARIEVAVLNFLAALSSPSSPSISILPLISRKSANCSLRSGLLSDVSSVYLSYAFCKRSLMRENDAKAFVRVWKVMEMCYKILGEGKLVTQRELFYKLLSDSPKYFSCQRHVNQSIQDVVSLLRCTRQSLGIMASSRGALIGRLVLHEPEEERIDCSILGPSGHAITGDLNELGKLNLHSDARYLIVVEKRLAEDRLYNQLPCIIITAKGYPDIATRFILHRLSQTFPNMPIFALVDWNPAGLAILCTYKYGSISMGLESYRYACNVKWLGLRGDDLQLIPQSAFQELKPRDLQIAKSLLSSKFLQEKHRAELTLMVDTGKRAEIEALYCHGFDFLGKYIAKKIVQGDYI